MKSKFGSVLTAVLAAAAGSPIFINASASPKQPKPKTKSDHEAILAAEMKRQRKALRNKRA